MINRKFSEIGLLPVLGYLIFALTFLGLVYFLFKRTEFAAHILTGMGIIVLIRLSERKRVHFLKTIFDHQQFLKIRILENLISVCLFVITLLIFSEFILSFILVLAAFILAFLSFGGVGNYTIPTPFSQRPFEFTTGFRKYLFILLIPYSLAFISIVYSNFNLGFFSLLVVGLISFAFYAEPEEDYFVWNYNVSSGAFLLKKIGTGMIHLTILSLPVLLALIFFFHTELLILSVTFLACQAYLTMFILTKYTAYPDEINVPQGVIVAIGIMLPPVLIFLIPILYAKAKYQLNNILNDRG